MDRVTMFKVQNDTGFDEVWCLECSVKFLAALLLDPVKSDNNLTGQKVQYPATTVCDLCQQPANKPTEEN